MRELAKLIPSEDVREYMQKKKQKLTHFEQATLIYNHSGLGFSEKTSYLKELMDITEDVKLREEVRDRLLYDERCLSRFYENNGEYIYELQVYDPKDKVANEQGYFTSAEIAVACAKKFQENFNVHKVRLVTEEKWPEDCRSDCVATVCFDDQGQMRGYYSSEVEWTARKPELDRDRFENAFIDIQHPFRNGDFVRIKNNDWLKGEVCIVECSNDEVSGIATEGTYAYRDYSDASLRVAYIYGLARFGHEHIKIVDLEYAEPDEMDDKYELLCCARSLVLGEGTLCDLGKLHCKYI